MKRRMKTVSWSQDLKLNASRCFSGTHAKVRFTKETFVTSDQQRDGDVEQHLSKLLRSFAFQQNICYNYNTHGHVSVFSEELPVCLVRSYWCGYVVL